MKIPKFDKKTSWIVFIVGVIVLILICIVLIGFFSRQTPVAASLMATPVIQATPMMIQSTPTIVAPIALAPGDVWIVSKTKVDTYKSGRFSYIVDEFTNENIPTLTMRAHCMAPAWPAPEVGQKYTLTVYGILVPIEGVDSPLQRFDPMK